MSGNKGAKQICFGVDQEVLDLYRALPKGKRSDILREIAREGLKRRQTGEASAQEQSA